LQLPVALTLYSTTPLLVSSISSRPTDLSALELNRKYSDVKSLPVDGLEDRQLKALNVQAEVVDSAAVECVQDRVQWEARHCRLDSVVTSSGGGGRIFIDDQSTTTTSVAGVW